jgi:hypothetical protein
MYIPHEAIVIEGKKFFSLRKNITCTTLGLLSVKVIFHILRSVYLREIN